MCCIQSLMCPKSILVIQPTFCLEATSYALSPFKLTCLRSEGTHPDVPNRALVPFINAAVHTFKQSTQPIRLG